MSRAGKSRSESPNANQFQAKYELLPPNVYISITYLICLFNIITVVVKLQLPQLLLLLLITNVITINIVITSYCQYC